MDENEEEEKSYPLLTHLQVIRARTVCQASVPLGAVFRAWHQLATRHRRPTNYFGQIDASPEQRMHAERLVWEERERLTWLKFPFREQIVRQPGFDYCTLLFVFAAGRDGHQLEEWLRTKLGDPEPVEQQSSSVRVLTFQEEDRRMFRVIFVRVDSWNEASLE